MSNITVTILIQKCKDYYKLPGNSCGGNLHIVLDDGNLHKDHSSFCIDQVIKDNDEQGVELGRLLLEATKTQLKKLYKCYNLYSNG